MELKSTKRISTTGDSLIVSITKEAKILNLNKGDSVSVTIGDPSAEELQARMYADLLGNVNARYSNDGWLTPLDKNPDGTSIEDNSDDISFEDKLNIQTRLSVMKVINEVVRECTTEAINSENAYYSDFQRSFVTKFQAVDVEHDEKQWMREFRFMLEIFNKVLFRFNVFNSRLERLGMIQDQTATSIYELKDIEDVSDDPEKMNTLIDDLNELYREECEGCQYPLPWFVVVYITVDIPDDYPEYHCAPEFDVRRGYQKQQIEDVCNSELLSENLKYHYKIPYAMGPFSTEESARDAMSYIRVVSKKNGFIGDPDFVNWALNEMTPLMN